jgi:hypothetical protein
MASPLLSRGNLCSRFPSNGSTRRSDGFQME